MLTAGGRRVILGQLLARGGQGEVHAVTRPARTVFKRYHATELAADPRARRRLEVMIANPPARGVGSTAGHVQLAWPTQLALDDNRFVGYLMPAVDTADSVELHRLTNPSDRHSGSGATGWTTRFTWRYLATTAMNLALATRDLHAANTVIGDFNERNIRVSRRAQVTLLDCDSMQITDPATGDLFYCRVGRPEFTAPELRNADWSKTKRHTTSDLYPLGIHIYQLLLEGEHPFRGVWQGAGEKPSVPELAREGTWAHGGKALRPRPSAVSINLLPDRIIELFGRAFGEGASNPGRRPSADEWYAALRNLVGGLRQCRKDPDHQYPRNNRSCPWCARKAPSAAATGGTPQLIRPVAARTRNAATTATLTAPSTAPPGSPATSRKVRTPQPWVLGLLSQRLMWWAVATTILYLVAGFYFRAQARGIPRHDHVARVASGFLTWTERLQLIPIVALAIAGVLWVARTQLVGLPAPLVRGYAAAASAAAATLSAVAVSDGGYFLAQSWLMDAKALPSLVSVMALAWLAYIVVLIAAAMYLAYYLAMLMRAFFGRVTD